MTNAPKRDTSVSCVGGSGRAITFHRGGSADPSDPVVVMNYGTPHTGAHPRCIDRLAQRLRVQLLSVTRPGYPGSDRLPGRSVADAARDLVDVIERLGILRLSIAGYSGGGPHAVAQAALLQDRVDRVGVFASPAPFTGEEGWFEGMASGGGGLRAALAGREARERYQRDAAFDPDVFTDADAAALQGPWGDIGADARAATQACSDHGEVDDDLAFVTPWGADLSSITAHVGLVHAEHDRIIPTHHAHILALQIPDQATHILAGAGHVAVLDAFPAWMERRL